MGCSFEEFIRDKEPLQPVAMTAMEPASHYLYGPVDSMQTVVEMYFAPAIATSQAGSYPVFPVPSYQQAGYFGPTPLPITTAIPYTNEGFIDPTSYSIPISVPLFLFHQLYYHKLMRYLRCLATSHFLVHQFPLK